MATNKTSPPKPKKPSPTKLMGTISWLSGAADDAIDLPIKRAILRSKNEIVLDCECAGWRYDVALKRTGRCQFEGEFSGENGRQSNLVAASCTLYTNEEGYLLFGKWIEDTYEYFWWAALQAVDAFEDAIDD